MAFEPMKKELATITKLSLQDSSTLYWGVASPLANADVSCLQGFLI